MTSQSNGIKKTYYIIGIILAGVLVVSTTAGWINSALDGKADADYVERLDQQIQRLENQNEQLQLTVERLNVNIENLIQRLDRGNVGIVESMVPSITEPMIPLEGMDQ